MSHPLTEASELHGSDPNEDLSLRNSNDRCSRCGIRLHGKGVTYKRRGRFKMLNCENCYRIQCGFLGGPK